MKESKLDDLLKESLLETSSGFTDQLMEKLVEKHMLKFRQRLYVLVGCVIVLFGGGAFIVTRFYTGFNAFGVISELPKIGPFVLMVFIGLLVLMHLRRLIKWTQHSSE